jgi:hypothetical protein
MAQYNQAWKSYIGSGTQGAALGTKVAATKFQTFTSESLKTDRAGRKVEPGLKRLQAPSLAVQGSEQVSGSITGPLMPNEAMVGLWLAALFGNNNTVTGGATTGYTHVFNMPALATEANYPQYGQTIELCRASIDNTCLWQYIGMFAKSLTLNIKKDSVITYAIDWVGRSEETAGTLGTPTYGANLRPFEGSMADLKIATLIGSAASVEFTECNIKIDIGAKMIGNNNGKYPVGRVFEPPVVTLDFTYFLKESLTIYNYLSGNTEIAAKLILTHSQLAGSSSGVHSLEFWMPRLIVTGDTPNISSGAEVPHKVSLTALYDSTESYYIKATSVNGESGTYAV